MTRITIDSSVFISHFGINDIFTVDSNKFFEYLPTIKPVIIMPTIIIAETVINLAQQHTYPIKKLIKQLSTYKTISLDNNILKKLAALTEIPQLKTSDLIIALSAKLNNATLVTWDKTLLSDKNTVCTAITPKQFIEK